MKHGGKRKGAGRKPGRQVVTVTFTITQKKKQRLDKIRGKQSRGKYLSTKIP